MAYSEKYFLSFCNPLGQSCRVSILQDDFIGDTIELTGQQDPITIEYDNSDDFKFKAIIESKATIGLILSDETLSFSELWTSNERTFKVEYFIESDLEWTGFVIPEGFDYNLKGGKYEAILIAQDGLSTLEGILFKTDNNQFYGVQDFGYNNGPEFPFILILTEILRKLDLGIDIWTLVDYYEQSTTTLKDNSRESDPLSLYFANVKTYVNDTDREDIAYFEDVNEAWDCKKLLENICNIWGSRIYQQNGVWRIKSIHADSSIANPYTYESDSFIGTNPILTVSSLWEYEAYYSINSDINLDNTVNFYSPYNKVSLNDVVFSDTSSTTSEKGFYLIKGLDLILEVNDLGVVINIKSYEPVVDNYYWKKYNNTAGYLGREIAKTEVIIPCSNKDIYLKDNDATIRMDKVYKQFRVNFDYTFIRVGDSPINLLKNGNFALPFTQYGQLEAPPNWERYKDDVNFKFPRGRVVTLTSPERVITGGNTNALEMNVQYNDLNTSNTDRDTSVSSSFLQENITIDQKVKALNISGWVKYRYKEVSENKFYYPVFKAVLYPSPPVSFNGGTDVYVLENSINEDYDLEWTKVTISKDNPLNLNAGRLRRFFNTNPKMGKSWIESEQTLFKWYDFNLRVQMPPKLGHIDFHIHGLCVTSGIMNATYPAFDIKVPIVGINGPESVFKKYFAVRTNGINVPRPQFTGLELAYIPDPDEEVPKTDYIYSNGDINYTFQEDPIRIYNGDTTDNEIVSGIIVPTNTQGRNKWDTFNNAFGKTDIGMILCKSVMQQYYKPNRLLDCEFKADNFKYGDIISFDHIPFVKFIMLRGSFNSKRGYWEGCTLAEISNDYIAQGGIINNESLDPKWLITGNTRCIKDEDGINTGDSEREILDVNTNSESFGDYRWQFSGPSDSCPIGEPSRYFWGTDLDDYELSNFKDYTVTYEDEETGRVQVSYSNIGGNYIYFLHLSSLGSITQVSNEYQGQIISSFTYIADVTINGYLYRVLRQNFVTSEFQDFLLTYYIQ